MSTALHERQSVSLPDGYQLWLPDAVVVPTAPVVDAAADVLPVGAPVVASLPDVVALEVDPAPVVGASDVVSAAEVDAAAVVSVPDVGAREVVLATEEDASAAVVDSVGGTSDVVKVDCASVCAQNAATSSSSSSIVDDRPILSDSILNTIDGN